jgi:hypothetical protein
VRKVEANVREPRDLFALVDRDDAVGLCTGRVDEHERSELRVRGRGRSLDELARRLRDRRCVAQTPAARASPAR